MNKENTTVTLPLDEYEILIEANKHYSELMRVNREKTFIELRSYEVDLTAYGLPYEKIKDFTIFAVSSDDVIKILNKKIERLEYDNSIIAGKHREIKLKMRENRFVRFLLDICGVSL